MSGYGLRQWLIRDMTQIADIAEQWDSLYDRSAADLFQSRPWIECWIRHFGTTNAWRILCVERDGTLIGLVPFQIVSRRYRGLKFRTLEFLIRESIGVERGGILAADPDQVLVLDAFLTHLNATRSEWDEARLSGFVRGTHRETEFVSAAEHAGYHVLPPVTVQVARYMAVMADWESFMMARGAHFRRRLRNERNRLEKIGSLQITSAGCPGIDIRSLYEDALKIVLGRLDSEQNNGIPEEDQRVLAFVSDMIDCRSESDGIDLHVAYLDGNPLSCVLAFVERGVVYALMTKYDMEYARYSPGRAIMAQLVETAHNRKRLTVDFLSDWPHVHRFTDTYKEFSRIQLFHSGIRSRLLHWRNRRHAKRSTMTKSVGDGADA